MHSLLQLQFAVAGRDDYRGVLEIGREIELLAARTQNPRFATIAFLGQGLAWIRLGDLGHAEAALDRATTGLAHELGPLEEALGAGFSALCALRQERRERADALARSALTAVKRARWAMLELRHALFCVLEVYLADGRRAHPVPQIRDALAELGRLARRFPFAVPSASLFQGRYEWLRARPARAAACLRRSLRVADQRCSRYEQALAHYWLGRLALSAEGRRYVPEGATPHLREALALFERLGVVWDAARVREALQHAPQLTAQSPKLAVQ